MKFGSFRIFRLFVLVLVVLLSCKQPLENLEDTPPPPVYSITFAKNAVDAVGTMSPQTMQSGTGAALSACVFTRPGYAFIGWATTATGAVSYQNQGAYTIGKENVTLYAVWTVNALGTVIFDKNDSSATGTMVNQKITVGLSSTIDGCTFTKQFYNFAGWATTSAGPVVYADKAVLMMSAQDITLYAKWNSISILIAAANAGNGKPEASWIGWTDIYQKSGVGMNLSFLPGPTNADNDAHIGALAATDTLPDVFQVSRTVWLELVAQGKVACVDSFFSAMPVRTARVYQDSCVMKLVKVSGKSYALPQSSPIGNGTNEGVVIRKDWLTRLGLSVPVTLADYLAVAKAFTENDPDGNGVADTYGYGAYIEPTNSNGLGRRFEPFFGAYGVEGVFDLSSSSAFKLQLRKDGSKDALTWIKSLVTQGYIWPNWKMSTKDQFRTAWKTGKFGIMWEQHAALHMKVNYEGFDVNFPAGEWIVIAPPKGPAGLNNNGTYSQNVTYYAVSQKAVNEGKSANITKLLEWMAGDEGHAYLYLGGKTEADYTNATYAPYRQLAGLTAYGSALEMRMRYPDFVSRNGKTISPSTTHNLLAAQPHTNATILQIASLTRTETVALSTFVLNECIKFVEGTRDLATWPAFLSEIDTNGASTVETTIKNELTSAGLLQ